MLKAFIYYKISAIPTTLNINLKSCFFKTTRDIIETDGVLKLQLIFIKKILCFIFFLVEHRKFYKLRQTLFLSSFILIRLKNFPGINKDHFFQFKNG